MGYHVRVKVCGVRTTPDLECAVRCGADAVGLNFHPPSPRSLSAEEARELLNALPAFVEAVGVFVRKSVREMQDFVEPLGRIGVLQVHGGPHEIASAFPYHLVPAFQVRDEADRDAVLEHLEACRRAALAPSAVLIDGYAPGLTGGTGRTAPWELLAGFAPGVPLILAGGLTPQNVAEAVRIVRPWGVDVASGVESSPGRKDHERVRRFIEAAREAASKG
jgi:phosphoribosylanthranilate isomerase